jgi:hypothetical protein
MKDSKRVRAPGQVGKVRFMAVIVSPPFPGGPDRGTAHPTTATTGGRARPATTRTETPA